MYMVTVKCFLCVNGGTVLFLVMLKNCNPSKEYCGFYKVVLLRFCSGLPLFLENSEIRKSETVTE